MTSMTPPPETLEAVTRWFDQEGGKEAIAKGAKTRPYAEFRAEVKAKIDRNKL